MSEYNKLHYKQFKIDIKLADKTIIDNYCKKIGMSKASTIVNAIKYLMANDVNLSEWVEMEKAENEAKAEQNIVNQDANK